MNISLPKPTITPISQPFWEGVQNRKLSIQYCENCEEAVFYPRTHCPHCFYDHLVWKEISGQGKLKTWSIVHRSAHPAWQEKTPYVVGVVELAEGPSMLTHLLIESEQLQYRMDVEVHFEIVNDQVLPFFINKKEVAT